MLGPVTVETPAGSSDGTLFAPRDRVVLSVLAMRRGEIVPAEVLADALWGDQPPPTTWPKVVQGCMVRLRRILGPGAIRTQEHGYVLALSPQEVDSHRFERLLERARQLLALGEPDRAAYTAREALKLWRGAPLTEPEDWEPARAEAQRLEELRRDAEDLEVEACLAAGRFREVLQVARGRVATAPLRETRWGHLARAQYQAGRQADALRTLRQAGEVLRNELGLDPGPELVALEQAILRQDPLLLSEPLPRASAACPYLGLLAYDVDDSDQYFGRQQDVTSCLDRLARTGVLAVTGPSGSGKSSFVRAGLAAALVRGGRRVRVLTPGAHPADRLTSVSTSPDAVLVVDQCEEVVTLCDDPHERGTFLAALAAHAEHAPLVLALRADRLGELSLYPGSPASWNAASTSWTRWRRPSCARWWRNLPGRPGCSSRPGSWTC